MQRKNKVKQNAINEIATINGSKVLIENGEIKTILSKEIQQTGYMTVEEMFQLIDAEIKALYKMPYTLMMLATAKTSTITRI